MSSIIHDAVPDVKALHWPRREDYENFSTTGSHNLSINAQPSESPFLHLPRELRDMIYLHFLTGHRTAPPSRLFAGPRIFRVEKDNGLDSHLELRDDILYPVSIAQTNVGALLQTNRLIRAEVLELADKRNANGSRLSAELDVMASAYKLFPFWTRLPLLAPREHPIDVTVKLRVFSPDAFIVIPSESDTPCHASHAFLALYNQFVTCGPAFTRRDGVMDSITTIDTLTLRISNHDIYTPRTFKNTVHQMVRMCKALSRQPDARSPLRRIRVIEEDEELRASGAEREWSYDVLTSCSEGEYLATQSVWEAQGFALEPNIARLGSCEGISREVEGCA